MARSKIHVALLFMVSVTIGHLGASLFAGGRHVGTAANAGATRKPVASALPVVATEGTIVPQSTPIVELHSRGSVSSPPTAKLASLKHDDSIVEMGENSVLPTVWRPLAIGKPAATELVRCVSNGMQEKCYFRHLSVRRNQITVCGPSMSSARFPNPLYLPDGQNGPLIQYHRYRGHKVKVVADPSGCECDVTVERPTVFLYRMSGHSTYHLWENNLGPFYATLQDFAPMVRSAGGGDVNDPSQLLVVFTDDKPTSGPKAPHLLDQLLRSFTDVPLINASRIQGNAADRAVCFEHAIMGTSANSFPHFKLLHQMMRNIVGYAPPPPLPRVPQCLFISRNHHSVVRGRKIANEDEMVKGLNATLLRLIGAPLQYVQMETLAYREQVELAMNTNIMLSPHGGGVANCIWMAKGSIMVEFVAPVGKTLLNMYNAMCGKSGVKHISFLAEPDPADVGLPDSAFNDNPRLYSNMFVPLERMVAHAEKAVHLYRENWRKQQQQASGAGTG
jgi:hypothetical protein